MSVDTVYVLNHLQCPNVVHATIDNFPDSIGVGGSVTISNLVELPRYEEHLDSLNTLVGEILEYGIGYSDAISNIAFPLIIAIFAFAVPFLFSIINQINNQYNSEAIANMFKSSGNYKMFWYSIVINVCAMLVYGGISLLPVSTFHYWIGKIFLYLFIVLTLWMVVSILLFMKCCMLYHKPQSVIDEMKRRFEKDKIEAEKKDKKQVSGFGKIKKRKSPSGKKVWEQISFMYRRAYSHSVKSEYINRLFEMCRYAMQKNDYILYTSVWAKVYELQKQEMVFDDTQEKRIVVDNPKNLTCSFLIKTFECVGDSSLNVEIQGSLIRTWLQCFARDKYPNHIDFYGLFRSLFKIAGKGNVDFIEKYFADCKYTFQYVHRLPQILYVKYGDAIDRVNDEKKSRETWNMICDYHFVLAAFTHYMGLKILLRQILLEEYSIGLFPRNRQELLLTYARCKGKMGSDGGYDYLDAEELYGRRVPSDFLDKFTVLMFALLNDGDANVYFSYTEDSMINELKKYKTIFYDIGEKYKKDASIKQQYSKVCQLNFNKSYDEALRVLQSKPSKESFEKGLPDLLTDHIKVHLHNQVLQLKNFTGSMMWGELSDEKVESLKFGICPVCLNKNFFAQLDASSVWYYFSDIVDLFRNRAYYLYMQILLSWKCEVITATPDMIADVIKHRIDGHPEDFVFIDYDSHVNLWLPMNHLGFRHSKCENVDYVMCSSMDYLRDTYPYKQLENRIFLIRKQDLPALIRRTERNVDVSFNDQSNYEKNCMDLRASIDSQYEICYRKDVKITSFEIIPQKIKL